MKGRINPYRSSLSFNRVAEVMVAFSALFLIVSPIITTL
jgi:hypothetical protein